MNTQEILSAVRAVFPSAGIMDRASMIFPSMKEYRKVVLFHGVYAVVKYSKINPWEVDNWILTKEKIAERRMPGLNARTGIAGKCLTAPRTLRTTW